jgi:deoxyribonuclease-4
MLMNDRRFWGLPMCLETPKGPDLEEDRQNLELLRSLIQV